MKKNLRLVKELYLFGLTVLIAGTCIACKKREPSYTIMNSVAEEDQYDNKTSSDTTGSGLTFYNGDDIVGDGIKHEEEYLITSSEDGESYVYDDSIIELVDPVYRNTKLYTNDEILSDETLLPYKTYGAGEVAHKDYAEQKESLPGVYRYIIDSNHPSAPNFMIYSKDNYAVGDILIVWGEAIHYGVLQSNALDLDNFKVVKYGSQITDWSSIKTESYPYIDDESGVRIVDTAKSEIQNTISNLEVTRIDETTEYDMDAAIDSANAIYKEFANTESNDVVGDAGYGYIIEGSESRYLNEFEIAGMSSRELRFARNEIFARHGRMFTSTDLQNYFNSMDWYVGSIPTDKFDDSVLNDMERYNIDLIAQMEEK